MKFSRVGFGCEGECCKKNVMYRVWLNFALILIAGFGTVPAHGQDAAFKKAFGAYRAGDLSQARDILSSVNTKERSALDFSLLGSIEFQERQFAEAEHDLKSALSIEPALVGTRFMLGNVLEAEGNSSAAKEAFKQVLARNSQHLESLLALSALDVQSRQFESAAVLLERGQKIAPEDIRILLSLARVRHLQGHREAALALLLNAKKLRPDDVEVLYAVGVLCLEMDLIKDATANLERAVQMAPADQRARYALASARVANRDLAGAISLYQDLLKATPNDAQTNYALGAAYFLQNDNEDAKRYFEQSMKIQPQQVESLYYLGVIAGQEGNNSKSIDLLKTVIARSFNHPRAHIALGMEYRTAGLLQDAKRELETAIRLAPDSQKAHYQLGLVLMKLHEQKQGKIELEMVERLKDPSGEKVAWQLAPLPDQPSTTVVGKGR